jgi:hypothetical protein
MRAFVCVCVCVCVWVVGCTSAGVCLSACRLTYPAYYAQVLYVSFLAPPYFST